jgi:hypothetical protein
MLVAMLVATHYELQFPSGYPGPGSYTRGYQTGTMDSSTMKLSVRISDLGWSRLISERAKIRASAAGGAQGYPQAHRKPPEGG